MKYRITDLKNFVETCSCPTISQAAQRLEISQPALSESIRRLESDLGYLLFYRSRTGIKLTSSGREFLPKSQRVLNALQELDSKDTNKIFGSQTISIGCHAVVAQYCFPSALRYLKTVAPDYKITLHHDLSRTIQSEVQRGNLDIGIVINPVQVPDLVVQKLAFDTIHIWRSPDFSKSACDTVICNQELFQSQSILKRWKNKPQRIISTSSLELICRLTQESLGYGIVPERAVLLSGFKLKKENSLPSYKDEISLIFRPEFGKTKSEKALIEAFRKSIIDQ